MRMRKAQAATLVFLLLSTTARVGRGQPASDAAADLGPYPGTPVEVRTAPTPTQVLVSYGTDRRIGPPPLLRRPALWTLIGTGTTLLAAGVLGGLALDRAGTFHHGVDSGAPRDELLGMRDSARQLAFASDLLLGTSAVLGLVTLVLRFGTGVSTAPTPMNIEKAYQAPEDLP